MSIYLRQEKLCVAKKYSYTFKYKDSGRFKVNWWKKDMSLKQHRLSRMSMLISDKLNFKTKSIAIDKEEHFKAIKCSLN